MHSSHFLTILAFAATTVLGRPAPVLSEASSVIDNYAASASATIADYIETGLGGLTDDKDTPHEDASTSYITANHTSSPWNTTLTHPSQPQDCMTREDALKVAGTFQSLIQGYTKEQALAALTPNFLDYSSAVSIIINRGGSGPEDVTAPIFTSRDEFMQGHGTQEPIPFETLRVWHTCEGVVSMVWRSVRSAQGQETESAAIPVTGTAVLETEPAAWSEGVELERALAGGYKYRIHTLWSEFNTAAWLVNNGALGIQADVPVIPPPETETTPSPPSLVGKRGLTSSKFDVGLA